MAKTLNDLKSNLTSAQIRTLRPENEAFLRGDRAEAALDCLWSGWKTVGKAMIVIGVLAIIAVVGLIGYFGLWNSSLAIETEGTIDSYKAGTVHYHYVVDGQRYDKVEDSSRSISSWRSGNEPYPVVYLSFRPSTSKLEHNVEPIDWFPAIFLLIVAGSIPALGFYTIRFTQRMMTLRDEATHLLQGEVYKAFRGQKGTVNYLYQATSPVSGQKIEGMLTLGKLNPRFGRIETGATVAVLYKDDKLHTVL